MKARELFEVMAAQPTVEPPRPVKTPSTVPARPATRPSVRPGPEYPDPFRRRFPNPAVVPKPKAVKRFDEEPPVGEPPFKEPPTAPIRPDYDPSAGKEFPDDTNPLRRLGPRVIPINPPTPFRRQGVPTPTPTPAPGRRGGSYESNASWIVRKLIES